MRPYQRPPEAHNPKVAGSNPAPATEKPRSASLGVTAEEVVVTDSMVVVGEPVDIEVPVPAVPAAVEETWTGVVVVPSPEQAVESIARARINEPRLNDSGTFRRRMTSVMRCRP